MRSDSARLSRIKHVLKRVAVASGTSGVRFYDDGTCSKTGLDGRFFGHKMCRIFRNIRSFELVVLDAGEISGPLEMLREIVKNSQCAEIIHFKMTAGSVCTFVKCCHITWMIGH